MAPFVAATTTTKNGEKIVGRKAEKKNWLTSHEIAFSLRCWQFVMEFFFFLRCTWKVLAALWPGCCSAWERGVLSATERSCKTMEIVGLSCWLASRSTCNQKELKVTWQHNLQHFASTLTVPHATQRATAFPICSLGLFSFFLPSFLMHFSYHCLHKHFSMFSVSMPCMKYLFCTLPWSHVPSGSCLWPAVDPSRPALDSR